MNIEEVRDYCLSLKGVSEHLPFGPDVLVFKVGNKMFALCDLKEFKRINLKCDPEKAIELREKYRAVGEAYHMNKTHWNSVQPNQDLLAKDIYELIDHSYALIFNSLPKKIQDEVKKGL